MHSLRLFVAAALLPALGLPSPACAQVYLGLDATLSSPYVWRGVTRANGWVVQPEGFVSLKAGGGFLSGGVWASYELANAGPNDLSDLGTGGVVPRAGAGGTGRDSLHVPRNRSDRRPHARRQYHRAVRGLAWHLEVRRAGRRAVAGHRPGAWVVHRGERHGAAPRQPAGRAVR